MMADFLQMLINLPDATRTPRRLATDPRLGTLETRQNPSSAFFSFTVVKASLVDIHSLLITVR